MLWLIIFAVGVIFLLNLMWGPNSSPEASEGCALIIAAVLCLGGIYFLVQFVKWAWYQ